MANKLFLVNSDVMFKTENRAKQRNIIKLVYANNVDSALQKFENSINSQYEGLEITFSYTGISDFEAIK